MQKLNKRYIIFLISIFAIVSIHVPAEIEAVGADDSPPFDDVSESFAIAEIVDLHKKGIIDGIGDRRFAPERAVTRAEFSAMLLRALHLQPIDTAVPAFSDVSEKSWYYGTVQALKQVGVISGTGDGHFDPIQGISRQEAAAMLTKALKQSLSSQQTGVSYKDAGQISAWALTYVNAAERIGLMKGYSGQFRPLDPISRQEAAVVFDRILKNWGDKIGQKPAAEIHLGWMYNQTGEQFKQSVLQSEINTISPRWFFVKSPSELTNQADPSMVEWAHERGKAVWAMVGNRFDREVTHQLLSQPELVDQLVDQLTGYVKDYRLDGLNIDFENVDPKDRNGFTSFISKLGKRLDAAGAVLSVCVPPDSGTDWSEAYDYEALGRSADYIVLMGYDEHWSGGPKAGSVSSISWLKTHIQHLTEQFPAEQLIVGLPLYTRDWHQNGGKTVSADVLLPEQEKLLEARRPIVRWDAKAGQYVALYWDNETEHRVWMEEGRSLSLKYLAGAEAQAAGFAYWHAGGGTEVAWASLSNARRYAGYF